MELAPAFNEQELGNALWALQWLYHQQQKLQQDPHSKRAAGAEGGEQEEEDEVVVVGAGEPGSDGRSWDVLRVICVLRRRAEAADGGSSS